MRPRTTAGPFRARPLAAQRGRFAHRYTTCRGCRTDLLDVDGTGLHPDPDCHTRAGQVSA